MNRLMIMFALAAGGCVAPASAGVGFGTATLAAGHVHGPGVVAVGSYADGEDAHWFRSDDYLVSEDPMNGGVARYLYVAKMTEIATDQTKAEAHFLLAKNGAQMWTATFFRSRVARQSDLVIGAPAICPNWGNQSEGTPKDKHHSRDFRWQLAPITDDSDLYKGRVTIGGISCAVGAVRVPVR